MFETRVNEIVNEIIQKKSLPENSIYIHSNISTKGKKEGQEISKSLCISEPDYPIDPFKKNTQNKSYVIMNIKSLSNFELQIRKKQFEEINYPAEAKIKELKSDQVYKHIVFDQESENLYAYIRANVVYCVEHYTSSNSFGCCCRYEECSNAKTCLHENKLYATGCFYRKNLESGRIFYGVNRNE